MACSVWIWCRARDGGGTGLGPLTVCTVSIVPSGDGLRVVCNRDERRSRPLALVPRPQRIAGRRVLFPIDPASGGTWIGVNDASLTFVLLNRTIDADRPKTPPAHSRGTIIPALLASDALHVAVKRAITLAPERFAPFRLIALHGPRAAVVTSDGRRLSLHFEDTGRPLMFTSSSLGDAVVAAPRRELFERLVVRGTSGWLDGQYFFHRHSWPHATETSVLMSRGEARTVSRTVLETTSPMTTFGYEPIEALTC
jgi:hypothetical protein